MADIFEQFLGMSRSERVDAAKGACGEIVRFCKGEGLEDKDVINFLCALTKLFVSVDRSCQQAEYELFVDVTGFELSGKEFFEMTNYGGEREFVDAVLEVVGAMNEDGKQAVAIFGLCICSADGEVTAEEKAMIARTVR